MAVAKRRAAVALVTKAAIDYLHRPELVSAFRERDVGVTFLLHADYRDTVMQLDGCDYVYWSHKPLVGLAARVTGTLRYLRTLYPSWDPSNRFLFRERGRHRVTRQGVTHGVMRFLARYRSVMHRAMKLEGYFYSSTGCQPQGVADLDFAVSVGVGIGVTTEAESIVSWWFRRQGIPVYHIVRNYDHLSSKGYRGVPIERVLVWSAAMEQEAVQLQGVRRAAVYRVGSVRHNYGPARISVSKQQFYQQIGLDPGRKTVLFAGGMDPYHYFEILDLYHKFLRPQMQAQMIVRVYPDEKFTATVFMSAFIAQAREQEGIYVSIGSSPAREQGRAHTGEKLWIEEEELWPSLAYSDVVINLYSTIALEGCMFDKPVIQMEYNYAKNINWVVPPAYYRNYVKRHNRRVLSYDAMTRARSRAELIEQVRDGLDVPNSRSPQRRKLVDHEIGVVDGKACNRIVAACLETET